MSLIISNKEIHRIHVIDDDPGVRDAYLEIVKDMGLEGVDVANPIKDIESLFASIDSYCDGILFDYQLKSTKYSPHNGDVYGAAAYQKQIPFLISSHFSPLSMEGRRRFIPKAVSAEELDTPDILEAFELCIGEYNGKFTSRRVPIRTLVRIEGLEIIGESCDLSVFVPNWDPHHGVKIRMGLKDLPDVNAIQDELNKVGEARVTAEVNTGAEDVNELYFFSWRQL